MVDYDDTVGDVYVVAHYDLYWYTLDTLRSCDAFDYTRRHRELCRVVAAVEHPDSLRSNNRVRH